MMKMASQGESTSSLKAVTTGRKHETSLDRTTPSSVGGTRASRPRMTVPGLATVPAGPKGIDLRVMVPATSKEDSDTPVDDAARMRNAYSNRSVTKVLRGDRAQGQGGGAHSNMTQWETAREEGQPSDSSKGSLVPVGDDRFAPRQRSPLCLSSRSDNGEDADAPTRGTTRGSMRETRPKSHGEGSEDSTMDQHQIRLHSTGETWNGPEGFTPKSPGMVGRAAADDVAFISGVKSEPALCPPPTCDALDAISGDSDVFCQELRPLSSPRRLATPMRTRDKEGGRQLIDAEEGGSDPNIHGDDRDDSRALPADKKTNGNVGDSTSMPRLRSEAMQEESSRHHSKQSPQLSEARQPRGDIGALLSPDTAPAVAIETAYPLVGGQAEDVGGVLGREMSTNTKGQGVDEAGGNDPVAEQKRARYQAKRLALEVARLRAALRRTTSDLKTERMTRERIEVRLSTRLSCSCFESG